MKDDTVASKQLNPVLDWLAWTLATAGGWLGGVLLNYVAINLLGLNTLAAEMNANPDQVSQMTALLVLIVSMVVLLVLGGVIGALQWLVLRRRVPGVSRWAPATAIGFALGSFAYPALFMGVGVGLLQWLVLRRDLNHTGWWPLLSAVAWPLGYVAGLAVSLTDSPLLNGILSALISGAIAGAITGAILLWLLRENRAMLDDLWKLAKEAAP